jgi:hypothetical protein
MDLFKTLQNTLYCANLVTWSIHEGTIVKCTLQEGGKTVMNGFNQWFFSGGRRGTRTPKHFVNVTGESKNFKMLEFPLNQLQTYYGYLCDLLSFMYIDCIYFSDLNYKMVIFLSQTESTTKHFFRKQALVSTGWAWGIAAEFCENCS